MTLSTEKTDIMWSASYKAFRADIAQRRGRVVGSLASLQNQTGLYAVEHRRLIAMYNSVLDVIDDHKFQASDGEFARTKET